jgi:hypothetical protein
MRVSDLPSLFSHMYSPTALSTAYTTLDLFTNSNSNPFSAFYSFSSTYALTSKCLLKADCIGSDLAQH